MKLIKLCSFVILSTLSVYFFSKWLESHEQYKNLRSSHFVKVYEMDRLFELQKKEHHKELHITTQPLVEELTLLNEENRRLQSIINDFQQSILALQDQLQKTNEHWKGALAQIEVEKKTHHDQLLELEQEKVTLKQQLESVKPAAEIEPVVLNTLAINTLQKKESVLAFEGENEEKHTEALRDLEEQNKTLKHQIYLIQAQLEGFEGIEKKFQKEREERLKNEQILKEMTKHLQTYSIALERMEDSRQELEKELDSLAAGPIRIKTSVSEPNYYTVEAGDSLSLISVKVYGTARKWELIFEANRTLLSDPKSLKEGMKLQIPKLSKK